MSFSDIGRPGTTAGSDRPATRQSRSGDIELYAKIFDQIFESSIARDYQTRRMFMDLLAIADVDGVVDMTIDAIARRTNVPVRLVRSGIAELCKPDPGSRSQLEEGRRLILIDSHRDWGWKIVNYEHYRNLQTGTDRRQYFRDYKRVQRQQKKRVSPDLSTNQQHQHSGQLCQSVTSVTSVESTQAEAEAEAVGVCITPLSKSSSSEKTRAREEHEDFHEFWKVYARLRNVGEDAAARIWISFDCDSQVDLIVPCLASYAASRDIQNGAVMNGERWLAENARDRWRARWPPARASGSKAEETDKAFEKIIRREAERAARANQA